MDVNGDTLSRPHVGVCRLLTGYECDRLDGLFCFLNLLDGCSRFIV